jgi:hypothetical protein
MQADIVEAYLKNLNLDLRISHNARFMDQKLTHDNLSFIADCVMNLVADDYGLSFTTRDVWDSEYFQDQVVFVYSKPNPKDQAENEYDKFINQPLRLLAYVGVLKDEKIGTGYVYTINSYGILQYIALNHINAFKFLAKYLTKVLADSDEIRYFNDFENKYKAGTIENEDLITLREHYSNFIQSNTLIKGDLEPNRIFNKILNILAIERKMPGAQRGHITTYPMVLKDLEYNTVNWRDLDKRKDITRDEALKLSKISERETRISNYEMVKAKNAVRRRHLYISEVGDDLSTGEATQVHHIFPDSQYAEYRASLENLILLTPSQHNTRAHPRNFTQRIDKNYQLICLIAKLNSIEESELAADGFYSLKKFIAMLNKNLRDIVIPPESDVAEIKAVLESHFTIK